MIEAKIRRLEALAASTTFDGERDAALAAIARLRRKTPAEPQPAEPQLSDAQARDKQRAIFDLKANLIAVENGEEIYFVHGKGSVTEMDLFMLWVDWQAGERW